MNCHLHGLSVLVTRPANQADGLCDMIDKAHGRPLRFPAMEILPIDDPSEARDALAEVEAGGLLVFVSTNAVRYAFPLLPDELPVDLQIAAIGEATAASLEAVGLPATLIPDERFDSEGLLALDVLQDMRGRKVWILRGHGGRELLRQEFEKRGAEVDYAEVYIRRRPRRNADNLVRGWEQLVDVVTVTSAEMLDNLLQMLAAEGKEKLCQTPLIVLSQRIADHAIEQGCRQVLVTDLAGDRGILRKICEYVESR